jgi:hypothetical protein
MGQLTRAAAGSAVTMIRHVQVAADYRIPFLQPQRYNSAAFGWFSLLCSLPPIRYTPRHDPDGDA